MTHMVQTRDEPGTAQRARQRHADIVAIIRRAKLDPVQRALALEYCEAAAVAAGRDRLGGATYLTRAADELAGMGDLSAALRDLAGSFVHPGP
jgi:hypothetical protein